MSLYGLDDPGPEVFETSDVESIEDISSQAVERRHSENDKNLEISEEGYSASSVRERFESFIVLEPNDINYLGSVLSKNLGEVGLSVARWAETKEQKLNRIERELQDLKEVEAEERLKVDAFLESLHEIAHNDGKNGYYYQNMKHALETLESSANKIHETCKSADASALAALNENIQNTGNSEKASKIMGEITDLDARMARIEASLGSIDDLSQKNLRVHLNDLERKVGVVLNPSHSLEPVISKVSQLSKSLENLLASERKVDLHLGDRGGTGRKLSSDTPFEMKIDRIYSKLPQIEEANQVLPSLVNRLRSLHETHSSLAASVAITGSVDQTLHTLLRDMQDWQKSLQEMSDCLESKEANFAANSAVVDRKLRLMEEKLAGLLS